MAEPTIIAQSGVCGRGVWRPQGDSNPRYRRERAVSWAGLDDGDACAPESGRLLLIYRSCAHSVKAVTLAHGRRELRTQERGHGAGDGLHHWRYHRVAELAIGLGVGYGNAKRRTAGAVEAHEASAFARRKPARARVAANQDLRSILVVTGGQGPRVVFRAEQAKPEPVAFGAVLCRVRLKIGPQPFGEHVFL